MLNPQKKARKKVFFLDLPNAWILTYEMMWLSQKISLIYGKSTKVTKNFVAQLSATYSYSPNETSKI